MWTGSRNIILMINDLLMAILHPSEKMHWFQKREWNLALIDQYRQSMKILFEKEYGTDNLFP